MELPTGYTLVIISQLRDKKKEEEEMAECTFRPFLAAKDAFMKKRVRVRLKLKEIIAGLAREQKEHLDMLER